MAKRNYVTKTVTDPVTHKRVYFYGTTEREVNRKILAYQTKRERGRLFSEVADEWWGEAYDELASQSVKVYKPALARAIDTFGNKRISEIQPRDVHAFLKRMATQGFAQKTVSNQRIILNKIFIQATLSGDIQYNPCASVSVPKGLAKAQRTAASLSDEEKIARSEHTWTFPLIALYSGLRKGEILALKWKDINFDENVIHVTKSVYHEGDRPYVKTPKTAAGTRDVPLLAPLRDRLLSERGSPENYVISDTGDAPLTKRRFTTLYTNYSKEVGISCTAHQLRHSFATVAIENGIDVKSVSEILGHKQISTTLDIYTDFRKSSLEKTTAALNTAFATK